MLIASVELKTWRAVHVAGWESEHCCDSCGVRLAGFDYRRRVFREEHKRGTRQYSTLTVERECDSVGCAL